MVSDDGYCTLAEVEEESKLDYSSIDSTAFSDTNVEATITIQEQKINGYLKVSSAETITDGIQMCTIMLSVSALYKQIKTLYPDNTINIKYLADLDYLKFYLGESSNKRDFGLVTGITDRFWS